MQSTSVTATLLHISASLGRFGKGEREVKCKRT